MNSELGAGAATEFADAGDLKELHDALLGTESVEANIIHVGAAAAQGQRALLMPPSRVPELQAGGVRKAAPVRVKP